MSPLHWSGGDNSALLLFPPCCIERRRASRCYFRPHGQNGQSSGPLLLPCRKVNNSTQRAAGTDAWAPIAVRTYKYTGTSGPPLRVCVSAASLLLALLVLLLLLLLFLLLFTHICTQLHHHRGKKSLVNTSSLHHIQQAWLLSVCTRFVAPLYLLSLLDPVDSPADKSTPAALFTFFYR